jgi:hypothetical protein
MMTVWSERISFLALLYAPSTGRQKGEISSALRLAQSAEELLLRAFPGTGLEPLRRAFGNNNEAAQHCAGQPRNGQRVLYSVQASPHVSPNCCTG